MNLVKAEAGSIVVIMNNVAFLKSEVVRQCFGEKANIVKNLHPCSQFVIWIDNFGYFYVGICERLRADH